MNRQNAEPIELIATPDALNRFCDALGSAPYLTVDTEFIRERTYYPRLCLVQIASDSMFGCVDALALDDLAPLFELLQTATITKVLHAARQDLEIFLQHGGSVPAPVFDTQIAADLCGLGNQAGLASVAEQLLGIELDKQHSRADWSKRPLRQALLRYAADDVRHLVPIFEQLRTRLEALGRTDWLVEDCTRLLDPALYQVDPDDSWERVGGIRRLNGSRFHAARLLASWRERRAMQMDRPRGWILRDDALMAVATALPADKAALERIRLLPPAVRRKAGDELLHVVEQARSIDTPAPGQPEPLTPEQKTAVAAGMKRVRSIADNLGLSPAMLATRREVTRLVRGATTSPVLEGWRKSVVGESLLDAIGPPVASTGTG